MASPVSTTIPSVSSVYGKHDKPKEKLIFPGTTRILLEGRLITSGSMSFLWATLLAIFLPTCLTLIFLLDTILTVFPSWIFIPWVGLLLVVLASALMTAYTDPGILPRGVNPASEIRMNGSTDYGGEPVSLLYYHPNCPTILLGKEISKDGKKYFLKYCGTCQLFRPPRASHCSFCDNCVEEFDHHCPWLSNCIGRRNIRDFMVFLIFLTILLNVTMVILGTVAWKTRDPEDSFSIIYNVSLDCVMIICIVGSVAQYTTVKTLRLLTRDKTTSEYAKGYEVITGRSCLSNYGRVFCARRPTRHVAWKDYQTGVMAIDNHY